ncbi:hypothetical protein AB1Y20_008685 [Prymnesium parvum]|uniref:Major facilitator superfamily (MFS) profile domain-containing protein n=1 Tax=Prymnesium parvum TaxID=97485 RepID=A0AB34ITY7_PRYPA
MKCCLATALPVSSTHKEATPLIKGNATSMRALFWVIFPALLGTSIEFYEYALYSSLTTEITHNFFQIGGPTFGEYGVWTVFGIGQAFRPIGALTFGMLSDNFGRKPSIVLSTVGMIVFTSGIGLLPTETCCEGWGATVGLVLLYVLRAGQGLTAAGELISVMAFAVEHAPFGHAGFAFALVLCAANAGSLVAATFVSVLESTLNESDMMHWGWRIPFLCALPVGLAIVYAQLHMPEPEAFIKAASEAKEQGFCKSVKPYRRQLFIATTASCLHTTFHYGCLSYIKDFLISRDLQTVSMASWVSVAASIMILFAQLSSGLLADAVGFSKLSVSMVVSTILCALPLWLMLVYAGKGGALCFVAVTIWSILYSSNVPILSLGLCLFPVNVRTTLFGICYNVAQLAFGATAPFIENAMVDAFVPQQSNNQTDSTPLELGYAAPAIWNLIAASVTLVGLLYYCRSVHIGVIEPSSIGPF